MAFKAGIAAFAVLFVLSVALAFRMAGHNPDGSPAVNAPAAHFPAAPDLPVKPGEMLFLDNGPLGGHIVPMALKDAADLNKWAATIGRTVIGGGVSEEPGANDDKYAQEELRTSGRIVAVPEDTEIKLLAVRGDIAQVEILQGVDAGVKGMVSKYCICRIGADSASRVPVFLPSQ